MTVAAANGPRGARRAVVAVVLVAAVGAAALGAVAFAPWVRGAALYHGLIAAKGRIVGHGFDLPPAAARCANCHDSTAAAQGDRPIGALTAATLLTAQPRRGGPPTVYDADSFCRTVRDGIDPAYVLVERTMPRFDLSEADCLALFTYVSQR